LFEEINEIEGGLFFHVHVGPFDRLA